MDDKKEVDVTIQISSFKDVDDKDVIKINGNINALLAVFIDSMVNIALTKNLKRGDIVDLVNEVWDSKVNNPIS